MRDLSGFDHATEQNLWLLDQQSQAAPVGGYPQLQTFIEHVVGVANMLPSNVRKLVTTSQCYIGSAHWGKPDAWCQDQWRAITGELAQGLDRVEAQRDKLLLDPALCEREQTAGEKILAACRQLRERGNDLAVTRNIQWLGAGSEMAGDARELERLFKLKRKTHMHDIEIARRIAHIEIIAQRFHHR